MMSWLHKPMQEATSAALTYRWSLHLARPQHQLSMKRAQVKHMDKRMEEDVSAEELPRFLHALLGVGSHAGQAAARGSLQRSSLSAGLQPDTASPGEEVRRRRR